MSTMHDGHRNRLRARFEENGPGSLAADELLELLLFYVIPRRDTHDIAFRLLEQFASFADVLDAPEKELRRVDGIGNTAASFLHMLPQLCRYYTDCRQMEPTKKFNTVEDADDFLADQMGAFSHERVFLMLLDADGLMLTHCQIAEGDMHRAEISPTQLIAKCAALHATYAILAHNHPSGVALPSAADLDNTRKLAIELRSSNVVLLDHIVCADNDYVSMYLSQYYYALGLDDNPQHRPVGNYYTEQLHRIPVREDSL